MAIDSPLYRDTGIAADYSAEFTAATTGAGVHDASYYGRLKATGEDALDLLNRLSTNKVDHLLPGHWAPTVLTSDRGRIVDLLMVVNAGDCVYLVTSPGQQQPVIDWLDKYTIMEDLTVEDVSAGTAMLVLTGPAAPSILGLEDTVGSYVPGEQLPRPRGIGQRMFSLGNKPPAGRPAGLLPLGGAGCGRLAAPSGPWRAAHR